MKITKLTEAEFNARTEAEENCTKRGQKPTVKVYDGNIKVTIHRDIDDEVIEPGTYKSLVFIPCELVGEFNWVRGFSNDTVTGLRKIDPPVIAPGGPRIKRNYKPGDYNIINLENSGVLFAFV
jgi:hypothetical protein